MRTNQADNKHKQNERPRRQCLNLRWNILQRLDVSHVSRSNARERNLFDNLNLAVKKRTERFLVHGKSLGGTTGFWT
jgi:hypothetical protein